MSTLDDALDKHPDLAGSSLFTAQNSSQQLPNEQPIVPQSSLALNLNRPPSPRIRPLAIRDVPYVARFSGVLRLDMPDSLVNPGPGLLGIAAALPILRRERPTFVAIADGQRVGIVRFSSRPPDGRWVVSAIGASVGVYSPEPVWEALLAHGLRVAGLRGVRRVFARVPVGHSLIETMQHTGWVSYMRETVFRADRIVPIRRSQHDLRLQEPADTWAIHQLYASSTPRQVQEFEAVTSHAWHMPGQKLTRRGNRQTGWLLEERGELAAYARYTGGPRSGMIDAVTPPGQGARLGALLDGVISAPGRGRAWPIYCSLRGYMLDVSDELTSRGFTELGEQELLIRYTTATARTPVVDPVHFPVELRPALPRRAPTFLEGRPTDGTI